MSPAPVPLTSRLEIGRLLAILRTDFARTSNFDERITLTVWRLGQHLHNRPGLKSFVARRIYHVLDAIWVRGVIGASLPQQVQVGPGLRIPHAGRGVFVHFTTRLGSSVTIYHQVTIGIRSQSSAALIGDDVEIGAGAKILGPVEVGDRCMIGANAVVISDVPSDHLAVGVPATNKRKAASAGK